MSQSQRKALILLGGMLIFSIALLRFGAIPAHAETRAAAHETEPNGDKPSATPMGLNQPIVGNLSEYSDMDYYSFTLTQAGKVSFHFLHGNVEKSLNYWDIDVFDSTDAIIFSLQSKGTETVLHSSNIYLGPGTYYIRIKTSINEYYSSTLDYTLTVNYEQNNGQYEIEPNNTSDTATAISYTNAAMTGSLSTYKDIDYYTFTVASPGSISIGFHHANTESSVDYYKVTVFDSTGAQVLTFNSKGSETTKQYDPVYFQAGAYVVRVTSIFDYYYTGLDYSLFLNSANVSLAASPNMPSGWAQEFVTRGIAYGIVPQALQGYYTQNITRSEFCQLVVRYIEVKEHTTIDAYLVRSGSTINYGAFSDTQDKNVSAAHALGIVSGVGDGRFHPNGQITREQAATMLRNLQGAMGFDITASGSSAFADSDAHSDWARPAIDYMEQNGIMSGVGNNRFDPKGTYTREQAITTFVKLYEK